MANIAPQAFLTQMSRMMFIPRGGARALDKYPLDLDGSERQTRFQTGRDPKPYPPIIGMVSGFLPEMDWRVYAQMWGKDPSGPSMNPMPLNLQWQITIPNLNKVGS